MPSDSNMLHSQTEIKTSLFPVGNVSEEQEVMGMCSGSRRRELFPQPLVVVVLGSISQA